MNQRPLAPHASALPGCATPRPECTMIPVSVFLVTANPGESRRIREMASSGPPEVVFQALDVVFPQVRPRLDLDDDHVPPPDILDPVDGSPRDVEGMARLHPYLFPVPVDKGLAPHEMPVLGAMPVPLQAQTLPGAHEEPLDLASFLLVKDEIEAPGAIPPLPGPGTAGAFGIHGRTGARELPGAVLVPPSLFNASASPGSSRDLSSPSGEQPCVFFRAGSNRAVCFFPSSVPSTSSAPPRS